ncbi:MAG: cyclodeaminase/cyclohydrolase family protein [Deltaproteobacteria bacterium]|nr:cyclodeaminase/cyclohydrolase family protein [Deltaproteobacteria bacterium]
MYLAKPMEHYIDKLASKSPEPGGGSAAALVGSVGAALVSMVGNLTLGKEKYRDVQGRIEELLAGSEAVRSELQRLVQEDTEAFSAVSEAYKLPKGTDEEKKARSEKIQEGLKGAATEVPFQICEKSLKVARLSKIAAEIGNVQAVSDAGVAVLFADACAQAAAMNVRINLNSIRDESFNKAKWDRVQEVLQEMERLREEVVAMTYQKIRS